MVLYHCDAAKVTVQHRFILRHHVDKRLFLRPVLRGDRDFMFQVFDVLFCWVTLDESAFSEIQHSVSFDCWIILHGRSTRVVHHCCFHTVRFDMGEKFNV